MPTLLASMWTMGLGPITPSCCSRRGSSPSGAVFDRGPSKIERRTRESGFFLTVACGQHISGCFEGSGGKVGSRRQVRAIYLAILNTFQSGFQEIRDRLVTSGKK